MPEEQPERHINIHTSPEAMAGVYANFANVSHSDYEFTITFARVDHEVEDDEVPGVVVSRVALSPRFLRELIDAMEDNYSKWQTREGIKNLPEFSGGDERARGAQRTNEGPHNGRERVHRLEPRRRAGRARGRGVVVDDFFTGRRRTSPARSPAAPSFRSRTSPTSGRWRGVARRDSTGGRLPSGRAATCDALGQRSRLRPPLNVGGTIKLLEMARRRRRRSIVFASTGRRDLRRGRGPRLPLDEDAEACRIRLRRRARWPPSATSTSTPPPRRSRRWRFGSRTSTGRGRTPTARPG